MLRTQVKIKSFSLVTQIIAVFHAFSSAWQPGESSFPCARQACCHSALLQEAGYCGIIKSSASKSLNTQRCSLTDHSLCPYLTTYHTYLIIGWTHLLCNNSTQRLLWSPSARCHSGCRGLSVYFWTLLTFLLLPHQEACQFTPATLETSEGNGCCLAYAFVKY